MRIIKVDIKELRNTEWFVEHRTYIMFYLDYHGFSNIAESNDIYLPDWFEDWENPTDTEMSLFELTNGYKIEFI